LPSKNLDRPLLHNSAPNKAARRQITDSQHRTRPRPKYLKAGSNAQPAGHA
jgi:hypothetical protein